MLAAKMLKNSWNRQMQSLRSVDVQIMGNVVGKVSINDLCLEIEYKKQVSVTNIDYQRSKDLRNAIMRGWVVLIDKVHQQNIGVQKEIVQENIVKENKVNMDDMKEMARAMAKEMAQEMVKEIIQNMPTQTIVQQTNTPQQTSVFIENTKVEAVHVNTDSYVAMKEEKDNTPSIDLSGSVELQQLDIKGVNSALENLKKLKKMKKEEV